MSPTDPTGSRGAFTALIADDEPLARANLRSLLGNCPRWIVLEDAASGPEVIEKVALSRPQVLFLDIRMPGLDGVEVARRLQSLEVPPLTVFVTAYDQHTLDAFELDAVDYLLKPFDEKRFGVTIRRLEARLTLPAERRPTQDVRPVEPGPDSTPSLGQIVVRSNRRIRFVNTDDLIWIAAEGNYVRLYLEQLCLLHRATLTSLEKRLDPAHFLRVQRGAIVRRDRIVEIRTPAAGRAVAVLSDGSEVDISQRYASRVFESLGIRSGP